jgi:hypothetical protein
MSSINIRVTSKAAGTLEEMLTTMTNQTTSGTGLRSIGRADEDYLYACFFGLVLNKDAKLVECPSSEHSPHPLTFIVSALANAREIFENDGLVRNFRFFNDLFANAVIHISLIARLFSMKPFQGALGALCAFRLKTRSDARHLLSLPIQFLSADRAFRAGCGDSIDAEVDAYNSLRVWRRLRNFYHKMDVKSLALPIIGQHSGFRSLTLKPLPLVIPQLKLDLLTTLSRGNRDGFGKGDEPNQVFIKIKTCWPEFFRCVLLTEGRGNTRDCSNGIVRGQSRRFFNVIIAFVVNVISPVFASFPRNLQSRVTGICEEIKSLKQRSLLIWRWHEFTGHSLIHSPLIYHALAGFQEGFALREAISMT